MCKSLRVFTCRFSFSCLRPYSDSIKRLLLENKEDFFSKSSINRVENHICRDIITHAPFCRIFFISSYPTFWKWNTFSRFNLCQTKKNYANSKACNSHCRSATRGYVRMRYLCVTDFFSGGNSCVPSVASEQVRATNSRFCSQPNSCVPSVARFCANFQILHRKNRTF